MGEGGAMSALQSGGGGEGIRNGIDKRRLLLGRLEVKMASVSAVTEERDDSARRELRYSDNGM